MHVETNKGSLQAEALVHHALETRAIDDVKGELLVSEHGEGRVPAVSDHIRCFRQAEVGILTEDGEHHINHELQATEVASLSFFFGFSLLGGFVAVAWFSGVIWSHPYTPFRRWRCGESVRVAPCLLRL